MKICSVDLPWDCILHDLLGYSGVGEAHFKDLCFTVLNLIDWEKILKDKEIKEAFQYSKRRHKFKFEVIEGHPNGHVLRYFERLDVGESKSESLVQR